MGARGRAITQGWQGEARHLVISRFTLLEIAEALGLDPNQVGTIKIEADTVTVTGQGGQWLQLPVDPDGL